MMEAQEFYNRLLDITATQTEALRSVNRIIETHTELIEKLHKRINVLEAQNEDLAGRYQDSTGQDVDVGKESSGV